MTIATQDLALDIWEIIDHYRTAADSIESLGPLDDNATARAVHNAEVQLYRFVADDLEATLNDVALPVGARRPAVSASAELEDLRNRVYDRAMTFASEALMLTGGTDPKSQGAAEAFLQAAVGLMSLLPEGWVPDGDN